MFWGTEVKDVQAITTWDNILISRLICGIPLHAFLSKAAWRTNNQHGRRERQGRQRAQHRGQRRKEKRKQVPEGEKASRNGQDGQGVGEATGDVGEVQEFTSHTFSTLRHRCPDPSTLVSLLPFPHRKDTKKCVSNQKLKPQIFWSLIGVFSSWDKKTTSFERKWN